MIKNQVFVLLTPVNDKRSFEVAAEEPLKMNGIKLKRAQCQYLIGKVKECWKGCQSKIFVGKGQIPG